MSRFGCITRDDPYIGRDYRSRRPWLMDCRRCHSQWSIEVIGPEKCPGCNSDKTRMR